MGAVITALIVPFALEFSRGVRIDTQGFLSDWANEPSDGSPLAIRSFGPVADLETGIVVAAAFVHSVVGDGFPSALPKIETRPPAYSEDVSSALHASGWGPSLFISDTIQADIALTSGAGDTVFFLFRDSWGAQWEFVFSAETKEVFCIDLHLDGCKF